MTVFFTVARVVRTAYKTLRAAAGIMIVAHAIYHWLKRRGTGYVRTPQQRLRTA